MTMATARTSTSVAPGEQLERGGRGSWRRLPRSCRRLARSPRQTARNCTVAATSWTRTIARPRARRPGRGGEAPGEPLRPAAAAGHGAPRKLLRLAPDEQRPAERRPARRGGASSAGSAPPSCRSRCRDRATSCASATPAARGARRRRRRARARTSPSRSAKRMSALHGGELAAAVHEHQRAAGRGHGGGRAPGRRQGG